MKALLNRIKNYFRNKRLITDKYIQTFTKVWISRLLWFGCLWVTASYVLAFLGKAKIAESLSKQVVVVIISVILGYLLKSFFETYSEKKFELVKMGLDEYSKPKSNVSYSDTDNEEESCQSEDSFISDTDNEIENLEESNDFDEGDPDDESFEETEEEEEEDTDEN